MSGALVKRRSSKQPAGMPAELVPGVTICLTGNVPLKIDGDEVLPAELLERCENTEINSCGLCQRCLKGVLRMINEDKVITRKRAEEIGAILPPSRKNPAQQNITRAMQAQKKKRP